MFYHIRPLRPEDITAVEAICLHTAAPALQKTARRRESTLLLYNRCYTRTERAFCFVAAEEHDRPVGYILCAPQLARFQRAFSAVEAKALLRLGLRYWVQGRGAFALQKPYEAAYPAHLHIDLLPEAQGQGVGSQLMQTLLQTLRRAGVPGVFLCVGADNARAIAFYEKHGFTVLRRLPGGVCMGRRL